MSLRMIGGRLFDTSSKEYKDWRAQRQRRSEGFLAEARARRATQVETAIVHPEPAPTSAAEIVKNQAAMAKIHAWVNRAKDSAAAAAAARTAIQIPDRNDAKATAAARIRRVNRSCRKVMAARRGSLAAFRENVRAAQERAGVA